MRARVPVGVSLRGACACACVGVGEGLAIFVTQMLRVVCVLRCEGAC